ncbi:MAG: hypothetical protein ACE5J3_03675 [Methanosarcinales archaeon]
MYTRKVPILILALFATIIIGALIAFSVKDGRVISRPESNLPLAKTADKCATCHTRVTPLYIIEGQNCLLRKILTEFQLWMLRIN